MFVEWKNESILENVDLTGNSFWSIGGRECILKNREREKEKERSKSFLEYERLGKGNQERWKYTQNLHPAHIVLDIGVLGAFPKSYVEGLFFLLVCNSRTFFYLTSLPPSQIIQISRSLTLSAWLSLPNQGSSFLYPRGKTFTFSSFFNFNNSGK